MSHTPVTPPSTSVSPPMTPDRWQRIDAVVQGALAVEPSARGAWVARACEGDDILHYEVTSLLAADARGRDTFLERPAVEASGARLIVRTPALRLAESLRGQYHIEGEIAQGGMSTVYLARDLRHERSVAIKVLREDLAAALGAQRFLEEIRVTASLQHPHILPLFDSGNADGLLWYAMPFVEGETLRARLKREGTLSQDEALRFAHEVADALEYAHRHGVVHRDIKPENILLRDGHAVVADFGVSLALAHAGGDRLTRTGISVGTPQYMAPEQVRGERLVDARADVFALGTVLHEMLEGRTPLASGNLSPLRAATTASRSGQHNPWAAHVRPVLERALQSAPDDRFPSAAAFAAALADPGSPSRSSASPSDTRRVPARAVLSIAALMLVVGLVGGWAAARSTVPKRLVNVANDLSRLTSPDGVGITRPVSDGGTLVVVDREGRPQRSIAATRPWTPRFSPNGRRVAYGAFDGFRTTSDLWVTDLDRAGTQRLTNDDADSNDPQWSPDGGQLAYSANADGGKDVRVRGLDDTEAEPLDARAGTQFPSDWTRDGTALLVSEDAGFRRFDVLVQPINGGPARPYVTTTANESAARMSPDGRWVAYTSDESGRDEVYLDAFPVPGNRIRISVGGGIHPVWRGDGKELYYWSDGALVAVQLGADLQARPMVEGRNVLFRAPYSGGLNTMYDVSPDGQRFVIISRP